MNKWSRTTLAEAKQKIEEAQALLEEAKERLEWVREDELEKFSNASEGLQATEKFQKMEDAASELDDLVSDIEDSISTLDDVSGNDVFDL